MNGCDGSQSFDMLENQRVDGATSWYEEPDLMLAKILRGVQHRFGLSCTLKGLLTNIQHCAF
jgi:hypothetical protein